MNFEKETAFITATLICTTLICLVFGFLFGHKCGQAYSDTRWKAIHNHCNVQFSKTICEDGSYTWTYKKVESNK